MYNLIVKTAEAEIRALENTPKEQISKILPIIERTRGRKVTRDNKAAYPFDNRLSKIKRVFKGQDICLDVTSDSSLASPETNALYDPKDGYANWINFLINLKEEDIFSSITPTVLMNFEDLDFEANVRLQISTLIENFGKVTYRNPIEEEGVYEDMEMFFHGVPLDLILDCNYVSGASCNNVAEKCISRIRNLSSIEKLNLTKIIIVATSYPNNVTEFGDVERDEFNLSELTLYSTITETVKSEIIEYGDYGSINPVRNDSVVMARGWVPKIDVSNESMVFYHRCRRPRGTTAYADTYIQVARRCRDDKEFPKDCNNWGLKQILACAEGAVPASSPSFWISVRMNTHIYRRLQGLKLI